MLSSRLQATVAATALAAAAWTALATGFIAFQPVIQRADEAASVKTRNYYERLIADRQARLDSVAAELTNGKGSMAAMAGEIARRHAALALLLTELKGAPNAAGAMAPINLAALENKTPAAQMQAVQADQDRMVDAADSFAKTRADRLRLAFRVAGLNAQASAPSAGQGGPLIEAKDPRTLAAVLDIDTGFAARIQHAAADLNDASALGQRAEHLPFAKPVAVPVKTSGFGGRIDPFTHRGAFHPGQDFAGAFMTPIMATAPGVVSFTGQRNGYGNVVEIDHGGGFKTRYAHLQAIGVAMGQKVALGQRIGGMGSTGRSTGVHLHYETWVNGRLQDPSPFLKAGDYVQQND